MKYILILSLLTATAFAAEEEKASVWQRTKGQINEAAEGTDRVTRETIQKGKDKWQQRQEEKRLEEEREERAEYERLKKKYGTEEEKKEL